ncbi:glycosyltransferase family 1 protein [Conexibacter sp. DBS9H8]|uniref:glycosyltransferase family 4 protein n=1 Tax=Conexibacter sp. DBS9H8 TaxID=2937801 RepID=UPI00200BE4E7|nr:glycosyltransferase family 1 protein [Conexibacter sp. DBS9H8]
MYVGLNLLYLVPGATGGTETYARELVPALLAAAPDLRFTAFINPTARGIVEAWGERVSATVIPVDVTHRWNWVRAEQTLLPPAARKTRVELVHSLANTAPLWGPFRSVVTIHDLHFLRVPEAHLGLNRIGMRVLVPTAARRCDRILTDATVTATDLQYHLGVHPDRVDVVPLGGGRVRRAEPTPEDEVRRTLDAGTRPVVLSVSALRPHKNLERLISAVALIPVERRPLLVICGYPTAHQTRLEEHIRGCDLNADVRLLGWVNDAYLEGLYLTASAVLCPSLHEGFGLPVLEAMARGRPVGCSVGGALAEVAGDAAFLFEATSVRQISLTVERLLSDREEVTRRVARGRARADQFSWAATAAGTLASYTRALSAPA